MNTWVEEASAEWEALVEKALAEWEARREAEADQYAEY